MSYDYNALVSAIASHRRNAEQDPAQHLQHAVDTFSTLSTHCPMTPLLWMQYASDNSKLIQVLLENSEQAMEMRLQTLELGIAEFPGCAMLRLHYLQLLVNKGGDNDERVQDAFEDALENMGHGSHRNEGNVVACIFRLYVTHLASQKQYDKLVELFIRRAQTPMKDANDAIMDEFQNVCQSYGIPVTPDALKIIEEGRMWVSKTFGSLVTFEDEIDMAMHEEGILARHEVSPDDVDWESLIKSEQGRYWMGLGGIKTANAFVKYARACAKYKSPNTEDEAPEEDDKLVHSLALSIYERGVSECPTVESLWLAYLRHLTYLVSSKDGAVKPSDLKGVAVRAVRNCPYSLALYQQKLNVLSVLAETGQVVLDPDAVMAIVQEANNAKFLPQPQSYLDLYLSALRVVKRRIMSIVSKGTSPVGREALAYDDAEPMEKAGGKSTPPVTVYADLDADSVQEVSDLAEDLREMYDTCDNYLQKNHNTWTQGRSALWKDRAMTESLLLGPLMASLENSHEGDRTTNDQEMIRCYEKLVRLQQPAHPDSFAEYIKSVQGNLRISTPGEVLARLRKVRGLYQKALVSVKKHLKQPETESSDGGGLQTSRDAETALHCLCYDYLEFEQHFGSTLSYSSASRSIQKKLHKAVANGYGTSRDTSKKETVPDEATHAAKHKLSEGPLEGPASKKLKPSAESESIQEMEVDKTEKRVNLKVEKKHPTHIVHVGKLDYPAHPFTVRVSNLSLDTEDMDLVDLFKDQCGPIVHARILREKAHKGKGKSKGCAVVQFEERESVEKALQLSDEVGLHEKLIKVERTHMRAVFVVPPGMHRVNPKGAGRSSKRNESRKKHPAGGNTKDAGKTGQKPDSTPNARSHGAEDKRESSILAFRPRGVAHGQAHRKVHVNLSVGEQKGGKDKKETDK